MIRACQENSRAVFEHAEHPIANARSAGHSVLPGAPIHAVEPSHGAAPGNAVVIFIDGGNKTVDQTAALIRKVLKSLWLFGKEVRLDLLQACPYIAFLVLIYGNDVVRFQALVIGRMVAITDDLLIFAIKLE